MEVDLIKLHDYSSKNKETIEKSKECGCFYCLKIFKSSEIKDWIEENNHYTAMCPYCGIDAVIGDGTGYKVNELLLKEMKRYWFK